MGVHKKRAAYATQCSSSKAPVRIIRSTGVIWLTIFYSIYRLIVAGVERKHPWD